MCAFLSEFALDFADGMKGLSSTLLIPTIKIFRFSYSASYV